MAEKKKEITRRQFVGTAGGALAGTALIRPSSILGAGSTKKLRLAMVGTGIRGTGMWGQTVVDEYRDYVEFVGLCDINRKRAAYARRYIKVKCPTFINFTEMVRKTKPDIVIVTTVDNTHDEFIVKGMEMGCDIVTEKPMTTDEKKCQAILDTEKKTGKNIIVTFNYRYSPHRRKIKELLMDKVIGEVVSVDFNWYLDIYHGASYFRRWHRLRERSGTLLVHKATHHFDLLNWWLKSDPDKVFAYGKLEHYGKNGTYRHTHCRLCPHKKKCQYYWDISTNERLVDLYVKCESEDGYLRDGCVYRNDVDIYDCMAVQIKYKNRVQVSYSLNAFSPYEGYRIAFNGTRGRLEAWIHERQPWLKKDYDEIRLTKNFGKTKLIKVPHGGGGHGGGDTRLKDKIFKDPSAPDPYKQSAGSREGAMSILVGIAARKSIDTGKPIRIGDLVRL